MAWRLAGWAVNTGKAGAVAAIVAALAGSHWLAHKQGRAFERDAQAQEIERLRDESRERADQLREAQRQRDAARRASVRETITVVDPTGCADAAIPDSVRDALGGQSD